MKYIPLGGSVVFLAILVFFVHHKAPIEIIIPLILNVILTLLEYAIDNIKEHIDSKFKQN